MTMLSARGGDIRFESGLLNSLVAVSKGLPSTAVQLAKDSILAAEREGSAVIVRRHLDDVIGGFISKLLPPL